MSEMKTISRWYVAFGVLLLSLLAAVALAAQTTVTTNQFRGGVAGAPRLYMVLANGRATLVNIGTGFTLDSSGGVWTLNFSSPITTSAVEITNVLLNGTFSGRTTSYTVPESPLLGSLKVYINGVKALPILDYTFSNNVIVLTEGYGDFSASENNVSIDYRR